MEQRVRAQKQGDIYVSPSGNDQNPGTKAQPVKTPARALELARALEKEEKVIYLCDGEYPITAMKLTAADSGVTFFAEKEAVFNGGLTLDPADFQNYKDNIQVLDLSKYGVTAERIGQMRAFGAEIYESVEAACSVMVKKNDDALMPDLKNTEKYLKYYALYKRLYPSLKADYKALAEL